MTHLTHAEFDRIINNVIGERMPGRPKQTIAAVSQVQNYRCGSRMQLGAKVYHYGMANGILVVQMGAKVEDEQEVSQQIIGANAPAGSTAFWWVWVDLNHRPHPYQGCALTN